MTKRELQGLKINGCFNVPFDEIKAGSMEGSQKYEREHQKTLSKVISLVKLGREITYYNNFVIIENNSYNGITKEMIEKALK